MTLEGKGFFIWKIPSCENGNVEQIASNAQLAGLTHVIVKIADGIAAYHGNWGDPKDYTTPLVKALRARNIQVWGWHYVYGDNPLGEGNIAISRIQQYNLDGYVIDAEKEYKESGKRAAATRFMRYLRSTLPKLTIALSSFRYPTLHPEIPWSEFLEYCDIIMPQVYWMQAHNPAEQLARSVNEFHAKSPSRPVVPTGAAFQEYGWKPTEGEVTEFIATARQLNLSGVNFWEWSDARSGRVPGVWDLIKRYNWSDRDAPKDICVSLVDAMNAHDVEKIVSLYTLPAVHISTLNITAGFDKLRAWYNKLFNDILPNSRFDIASYSGKGGSRHFTWTATSSKGYVRNGNDTLGISHGKINYHYSYFKVTP